MADLFERWTGLVLMDPWLLLVGALLPAAFVLRRWRGEPAIPFAPAAFLLADGPATLPLTPSWRARLLPLPRIIQVAGLLLTILALARPVHREEIPATLDGIDILLCLDTSSSMTARDLDPRRSRLDVAKDAARRFVAGRPNDRIGLLSFARFADVRCPFTLDHLALGRFIDDVTPVLADGPEDATGIGTAVALAAEVLQTSTARSKVVILLTDGEENVATAQTPREIAPLHAGQLCHELGIRVYTIAAGAGNRGRHGEWVPIDPSQVRTLAERTGGEFFEAKDAGAVDAVYHRIDRLERVPIPEPRRRIEERFLAFLMVAAGLLLLSRVLQSTGLEVLP